MRYRRQDPGPLNRGNIQHLPLLTTQFELHLPFLLTFMLIHKQDSKALF